MARGTWLLAALCLALSSLQPEHAVRASRVKFRHGLTDLPAVVRTSALGRRTNMTDTKPLECFQVTQPVLGPSGPVFQSLNGKGETQTILVADDRVAPSCTQVLMEHSFGFSYGKPFVGNYTPPSCIFNRVIMNFTVTSAGRQFDRLALMYFGDTEVWRTSTAEPTNPPGIIWTYWKDMTHLLYFWKNPQTLIFDLGNLIDSTYTGPFNCTLTATYFLSEVLTENAPPADLIIPISARQGISNNSISAWNVPDQTATNTISFPRNVKRAVFSVSANGQANEEFWWSNFLQSDVNDFNATAGASPGFSPWREVRVLLDGQLVGVQWPFPVIFTGGVVPSFHRPIVGLDTFDLREHEIDITAWLPVLCDGKQHTFQIVVGGFDDTTKPPSLTNGVDSYWVVSGKIFVWSDLEGFVTTGEPPIITSPPPDIRFSHSLTQNSTGFNETLVYQISATRSISVEGKVLTSAGIIYPRWTQDLVFSNTGGATAFGFDAVNTMNFTGRDRSTGPYPYHTRYSYPLRVATTYTTNADGGFTIEANLYQANDLSVSGSAVYPTGLEPFAEFPRTRGAVFVSSRLQTYRSGVAQFSQSKDGNSGSASGTTQQELRFGGVSSRGALGDTPDVGLYYRNVTQTNDRVTQDQEILAHDPRPAFSGPPGAVVQGAFAPLPNLAGKGLRVFEGRDALSQASGRVAARSEAIQRLLKQSAKRRVAALPPP